MLCKISFEVPGRITIRQVPVKVWATLMDWDGEYKHNFAGVLVTTQYEEEQVLTVPKKSGGLDINTRVRVMVALELKNIQSSEAPISAGELREKLKDLAESLGMEFGLPKPPPVEFDDPE